MERKGAVLQNTTREDAGEIAAVLNANRLSYDTYDYTNGEALPNVDNLDFLVVMGGPDSANDANVKMQQEVELVAEYLRRGIPVFGVCLGMQVLVKAAGGEVIKSPRKEIGLYEEKNRLYRMKLTEEGRVDPYLKGFPNNAPVFQLHGETVVPNGKVTVLAKSRDLYANENSIIQMVRVGNSIGIQGHLEVTPKLLDRWLEEDPDLLGLDEETRSKIQTDFTEMYKKQSRQLLWQLFTNFLTENHLIKKPQPITA